MNFSKFELFLQKFLQTLIQFSAKFFYAFFTAPWLWLVGYCSVISVFFWYSYYTVIQERNLFVNQPDPSKFVNSVLFTPGTPINPVNYPQYYWILLLFVLVNFILSLLLQEMLGKKLSTILFWASWFVLIIFTIAAFPLFIGALW